MTTHEAIHDYYLHQNRNIVNYLELCLIHPDAELVHELRLSIKKLRAFHKLAEHLSPGGSDEYIRIKQRVRKLFKVAGQLRDTQVQIELIARYSEQTGIQYPEFDMWLKKREQKQIQQFSKKPQQVVPEATAQSSHQEIGALLALAEEETILSCATEVLSGLYSTAKNLSNVDIKESNLHLIRTISKQMKYILHIMAHSYPEFKFKEMSVDSLREIETVAGNWHDNLVRVELLERFLGKTKPIDDTEKFKYQKLYNSCKSELDITYHETFRIVRREFNPEFQD